MASLVHDCQYNWHCYCFVHTRWRQNICSNLEILGHWRFGSERYILTLTPRTALLMSALFELEILTLILFWRLFQRLLSWFLLFLRIFWTVLITDHSVHLQFFQSCAPQLKCSRYCTLLRCSWPFWHIYARATWPKELRSKGCPTAPILLVSWFCLTLLELILNDSFRVQVSRL